VRAALESVHRAVWSAPESFTKNGYLTIGFVKDYPVSTEGEVRAACLEHLCQLSGSMSLNLGDLEAVA
jgi:hypothetical protein